MERKFVGLESEMKELINEANGDLNVLANKLSLGDDYFSVLGDEVYCVFVDPGKGFTFDMPNGSELGAYEGLWMPGGKTGGGLYEAVLLNSESLVHNRDWTTFLEFYGEENVVLIKSY